jgi:hypothetical protein
MLDVEQAIVARLQPALLRQLAMKPTGTNIARR